MSPRSVRKQSKAPARAVQFPVSSLYRCALMRCGNTVAPDKLHDWRCAYVRNTEYRFCSDACWNGWLQEMKPFGWKPALLDILSSPGTPAIGPKQPADDIPLLTI